MAFGCFHTLDALEALVGSGLRPLLLYSGGLDGTFLLYELRRRACHDAVVLFVSLGGKIPSNRCGDVCGRLGFQYIEVDVTAEFVSEFVVPAIMAQGRYLNGHPISASLSRPCLARIAVETARREGCAIIVHTSTRSQNSVRRFNGAVAKLGFEGAYGSPFEFSVIPRERKLSILGDNGVLPPAQGLASTDTNIWCREFEYGPVNDPEEVRIPEDMWSWTTVSQNGACSLEIMFANGVPISADGTELPLVVLLERLNVLAGSYGIGRTIGLEEGPTGVKVLEAREAPAAEVLLTGYRFLESGCLSAEAIREKLHIEQLWVKEAVEGRWYGALRRAADMFIKSLSHEVNGRVRLALTNQGIGLSGIEATNPVYVRNREEIDASASAPYPEYSGGDGSIVLLA